MLACMPMNVWNKYFDFLYLKEWQRRKKRLEKAEKAARRKKHRVYKDENWKEVDRQSIGTVGTLEQQKEQCKQQ